VSYLGRIKIELYSDVPWIADNFLALCTGNAGTGKSGKALYYLNNTFYRIIPGQIIQGEDIAKNDDRCGVIYGEFFTRILYINILGGNGNG
jgi:peptidylprolyl isomerase